MRALAVAVLVVATGLAGCLEDDPANGTTPPPGGDGNGGPPPYTMEPLRVVARGSNPEADGFRTDVITTKAEYDAWWSSVVPPCDDTADCRGREEVDFSRERVVAVVGEGGDSCYDVRISEARTFPTENFTRVIVQENEPAPDAACLRYFWRPFEAVAIPLKNTDVVFERHNVTFAESVPEELQLREIERGQHSGIDGMETHVIEGDAAWRDLWARHASNREPAPPLPDVDFGEERVVAYFVGEEPSRGVRIDFTSAVLEDGVVTVSYEVETFDRATAEVQHPFAIAAIPAGDEPVRFSQENDPRVGVGNESPTTNGTTRGDDVPFDSIDRGTSSGVTDKRYLVIEDAAEWERLWAEHASTRFPTPATPEVDFRAHRVLAVFMGEQRSGGYGIAVTDVARTDAGLVAEVSLYEPPPDAATTDALTQPYHFVTVPADGEPVAFDERAGDWSEWEE